MNKNRIIIFVVALIFLIGGIIFLSRDVVSPYVNIEQTMKKPGKLVQLMGKLDKSSPIVDGVAGFSFTLIDENGVKMAVKCSASKPMNFKHSTEVVALGKYDPVEKIFVSRNILVKCPSKYKKEL